MAFFRAIVRLPYDSGLPEDVIVNTWHCSAVDLTAAGSFASELITFYQAIDVDFSSILDTSADACSLKLYDMADPEPRVPVAVATFTLADATGSPLPPECAICLSYQGDPLSGINQARRRFRVFLGPLDTSTVDATGNVQNATADRIRDAADALLAASASDPDWQWMGHSVSNDDFVLVSNGWVDNEFDTQRRRGRVASSRLTFS